MTNSVGNGAPLAFSGVNITRLADADAVALLAGRSYSGTPTATRTYTLPALSTTTNGTQVTVQNNGAFQINLSGSGTDQINDAGAPGVFALLSGQTAIMEAKILDGATAPTWFLASPPGPQYLYAGGPPGGQAADIAGGDQVLFSVFEGSAGSNISLDLATGIFTIAAGHTYEFFGTPGACDYSGTTGAMAMQWFNVTGSEFFGSTSRSVTATLALAVSGSPTALGIITTTAAVEVELRINLNTVCTRVGTLGSVASASVKQIA